MLMVGGKESGPKSGACRICEETAQWERRSGIRQGSRKTRKDVNIGQCKKMEAGVGCPAPSMPEKEPVLPGSFT